MAPSEPAGALAISQLGPGGLVAIPYEAAIQQNGDIWFEVGPFRAGEPVILEIKPNKEDLLFATRPADSSD